MSALAAVRPDTLTGQVAIVTGGGRGIGRAIATELAAAGAAVAITARSAEEIAETAQMVESAGGRAISRVCDVADATDVDKLVQEAEDQLGPVTLLVNNAATLAGIGPLWEIDPEDWRLDVDVTLVGSFNCARAVIPGMIARGSGRIVNVSSMNAVWGLLYTSSYDCAKTAQLRLTEGLAGELRDHGVYVFALAPGPVRTRMSEVTAQPAVAHWMQNRGFSFDIKNDPIPGARAGSVIVQMATGYADALSGRFVTVQDDLSQLVDRADEIRRNDLLTLRVESPFGRIENGMRPNGPSSESRTITET